MEKREMFDLKLYGAITEILPDGEISICEPIFTNCRDIEDKNLYRLVTETCEISKGISYIYPKALEKIDITQFGKPIFLPTDSKLIGNGQKYFIIFQSSRNATKSEERDYIDVPIIRMLDSDYFTRRDYLPTNITVGIKFPDKFIVVKKRGQVYSANQLGKSDRTI